MKNFKKGIALLELIFSIVIIAIALMSVPNLIKSTQNSANAIITQESISNAASYAAMIMSSFWDENCSDPKYENPIVTVQNQDPSLRELQTSSGTLLKRRVGSPITTSRLFKNNLNNQRLDATLNNKLGIEVSDGEPDDIDDYNQRSTTLVPHNQTTDVTKENYKDTTIQLFTTVSYISDRADSGYNNQIVTFNNPFSATKIDNRFSTNIKLITVRVSSTNQPNKSIILRAFSCNIGSSKLKERQF